MELKQKHIKELKALGYKRNALNFLQQLENEAHQMAEDECNGIKEYSTEEWNKIREGVLSLFNKDIRNYGFFINTDPRGYALKLKDVKYEDRVLSYTDMGGYQILCPDFN